MVSSVSLIFVYLAYLAFGLRRGMTYLHIFQQEEYDAGRFLRWLGANRVFDTRLSAGLFFTSILWFFLPAFVTTLLLVACFVAAFVFEKDPRRASKKKLVMTQRAQRVLFITLGLIALMGLWCFVLHIPFLWIANVQLIPFLILVANAALQPFENSVQQKFWNEGHARLLQLKPTVIGITGSYGKTSVKHILGHILKMQAPTLITPGSVNTTMGVTRIIREQLEETHKYFIVEMGAYGPGSIERLCSLASPDIGIITAIGAAHYERFKSLDTVAQAKFELAQAVIRKNGKVVVPDTLFQYAAAQNLRDLNPASFVITGTTGVHDLNIINIGQRMDGIEVQMTWKDKPYTLNVPLFGAHHGHNAALAFAAAATLGIPPENIVTALKSVPQIQHRLEVKKQADGSTIIDDAFNSNPEGFRAALEVMGKLNGSGRKILITPGMVELGDAHEDEHRKIGQYAGEVCDTALIVLPSRIPSFMEGFRKTGHDKPLIEVASFQEASAWLDKNRQSGDVVLIENDLPDLYERVPRI